MAAKKRRQKAGSAFPVGRMDSARAPAEPVDNSPYNVTYDDDTMWTVYPDSGAKVRRDSEPVTVTQADDTVWTTYPDSGVSVLQAEPIQVTQADGSVWMVYPDSGVQVMVSPPPQGSYDPGLVSMSKGRGQRRLKGER